MRDPDYRALLNKNCKKAFAALNKKSFKIYLINSKVAVNGKNNNGYIIDMSTSSVAVGKIEMQLRKGEDLPSKGWALGKDGKPTQDAKEAFYEGKGKTYFLI